MSDIKAQCEEIRKDYSPCDVSDCLQTLHVPSAGYLKDIAPIPSLAATSSTRTVAPISTILFVDRSHTPNATVTGLSTTIPSESNIPKGTHWTDVPTPGSVVLMQQPPHQIVGLLGDIVATRFLTHGIKGYFVDGRVRDVARCGNISKESKDHFTVWSKAVSSVGTSLEAKPWAVDVPITIGGVEVKAGDVLVSDEAEGACCVIPREKFDEVVKLLPVLKEADDGLLGDVQGGMAFGEAIGRWPKHYSNH